MFDKYGYYIGPNEYMKGYSKEQLFKAFNVLVELGFIDADDSNVVYVDFKGDKDEV